MDAVPLPLPALSRAIKLQRRAARVGFDWPGAAPIFDKILEELSELKAAIAANERDDAQRDELGDLLFAVINLGRHLGLDPEDAVRSANRKFERRFRYIEEQLRAQGRHPNQTAMVELDGLWEAAKRAGL
jgi:ATP diphosphatase